VTTIGWSSGVFGARWPLADDQFASSAVVRRGEINYDIHAIVAQAAMATILI